MLSLNHPHILQDIRRLGYGLMPLLKTDGSGVLVLKANKEAILTARTNNAMKIYLLKDYAGPASHLGLMTVFFEDAQEPMSLRSLLFANDAFLEEATAVLSRPAFELYFFDEHDRELMGVRVTHDDASRFRDEIARASFAPFDQVTFQDMADRLQTRFSIRDAADDAAAFTLQLGERLYPDDLVLIDGRPEAYRFQNAEGRTAISQLVRLDPGPAQERDIAVMLGRAFPAESIYLNPFRADTGKELTDVLVVTDQVILFIEAKDSPNTVASLNRSIDRKRLAIRNHIAKATQQLSGGLSYARSQDGVTIRSADGPLTMPLAGRQLLGLVVVREMFDDDHVACSEPVLALKDALQLPVILTDYPGLHIISLNLRTPARFINALHELFDVAVEHGEFPKSAWNGPPLED